MTEPYDPHHSAEPDAPTGEERAILAALAVLEAEDPERGLEEAVRPAGARGEDADATLRRLYVEALGLLAWEAPAEAPPEELKGRVLAAIGAGAPAPAAEVVPLASARRSDRDAAAPAPPRTRGRGAGWLAALAAVFALAAIGLAGWFYVQLDQAQSTLAAIEGERTRLSERLAHQEELIRRRAGMEEFLTAVSTAGVEICPLRPVGDPALHPQAFAILYMPPGSGEWYLLATNLAPGDGVYKVWLNTPDGPVSVGFLEPGDESALEIDLPPDIDARHELMLSIVVTLEPVPDMPDPSGPMVLFGDEVMKVL